jgi:hypothetical protein
MVSLQQIVKNSFSVVFTYTVTVFVLVVIFKGFVLAEIRGEIGKYAAVYGNIWAVRKYSKDLGFTVPESTVRVFKKQYKLELKKRRSEESDPELPIVLPKKPRGQMPRLGYTLDKVVQE